LEYGLIYKNLTKAEILFKLRPKLKLFTVPKLIFFNVSSYNSNKNKILKYISDEFLGKLIAIRSSSSKEDGMALSGAGKFDSFLDISAQDHKSTDRSIGKVISSYEKDGKALDSDLDQVLVQSMVQNVNMSGVIFTHDLNTGAPYYVINYDDQSGLTDTVTSGSGEHSNRTLYIFRDKVKNLRSERFVKLIQAVKELEKKVGSEYLDIEFALDENLTPYLLQVRPITTSDNWCNDSLAKIKPTLESTFNFVENSLKEIGGVCGKHTVLGQMPDWNPIEMIGRVPRSLARSLYEKLITNCAWSESRGVMGYHAPNIPLMLNISGQPFIDTRLSFLSYIPRAIGSEISTKLVDHWVEKLRENPKLHDKIEFEIAITTYSFDFNSRLDRLVGSVLTECEKVKFKQEHLKIFKNNISDLNKGSIKSALNKIEKLRVKNNFSKQKKDTKSIILELSKKINNCIELGTVPFSILARHGFIAKTILESLQYHKVFSKTDLEIFYGSIHTVAGQYVEDVNLLQKGLIEKKEFMHIYGHLRPGTYDITSKRYDQSKDLYNDNESFNLNNSPAFELSHIQKEQINHLLKDLKFNNFFADDLMNYVKQSISGREYGKFVFTRSVSDILEQVYDLAKLNEISRSEISHVPINTILEATDIDNIKNLLKSVSEKEFEKYNTSLSIRLPQLIHDASGVYIVPFLVSHPNFITRKSVTSQSVLLGLNIDNTCLKNKIILIEGADPGYDWIFTHQISGLITKYGGSNSHMAIRCAEFNIPAAVGCGEQKFQELINAKHIHLDCGTGIISSI
jgi:phosphohistidine swiveling domain-containing protein